MSRQHATMRRAALGSHPDVRARPGRRSARGVSPRRGAAARHALARERGYSAWLRHARRLAARVHGSRDRTVVPRAGREDYRRHLATRSTHAGRLRPGAEFGAHLLLALAHGRETGARLGVARLRADGGASTARHRRRPAVRALEPIGVAHRGGLVGPDGDRAGTVPQAHRYAAARERRGAGGAPLDGRAGAGPGHAARGARRQGPPPRMVLSGSALAPGDRAVPAGGRAPVRRRRRPAWLLQTGMWIWNRGRSPGVVRPALALQDALGLPVSIYWHWWHHGPYDTSFPDYLPPREGVDSFRAALATAHAAGSHAMVYMNQRLWCTGTPSWTAEGAASWAVKERDGRVREEVYNVFDPQPCATMDVTTSFWRAKYAGIADTVLDSYGVDGVYMDQAVQSLVCWDWTHCHPVGGGDYRMVGFRTLGGQ